jgi:hypothetical protein
MLSWGAADADSDAVPSAMASDNPPIETRPLEFNFIIYSMCVAKRW